MTSLNKDLRVWIIVVYEIFGVGIVAEDRIQSTNRRRGSVRVPVRARVSVGK